MGEKKLDAAAEELSVFTEQPELTKEEQIVADSYVESAAEQMKELKEAGYKVPEAAGGVKVKLSDAFGGIEQGFNTQVELSPEAQIEADSYVDSAAEIVNELKEAGYQVPETQPGAGLPLSDAFGGIEQGFTTAVELSPEEQLAADSYTESAAEQAEEIKKLLHKD